MSNTSDIAFTGDPERVDDDDRTLADAVEAIFASKTKEEILEIWERVKSRRSPDDVPLDDYLKMFDD